MKENSKVGLWFQRLIYVVFIFVIVEMLVLIQQNKDLKKQLNAVGTPQPIEFLKTGDQVASVKLRDTNGEELHIDFKDPQKQTLFFIFSTTCPHCEKNLDIWKDISRKLKLQNKYEINIIGISTGSSNETKEYFLKNRLNYTTLVADSTFERLYKVRAVPQTLLIKEDGKVKNNWSGELTTKQFKELMASIGS